MRERHQRGHGPAPPQRRVLPRDRDRAQPLYRLRGRRRGCPRRARDGRDHPGDRDSPRPHRPRRAHRGPAGPSPRRHLDGPPPPTRSSLTPGPPPPAPCYAGLAEAEDRCARRPETRRTKAGLCHAYAPLRTPRPPASAVSGRRRLPGAAAGVSVALPLPGCPRDVGRRWHAKQASTLPRARSPCAPRATERQAPATSAGQRSMPPTPDVLDAPSRFLVPACRLRVGPGGAGRAVSRLDVTETPPDLGRSARLPVRARARHLAARKRLRDPVGTVRIAGVDVPAALPLPQRIEAAELAR